MQVGILTAPLRQKPLEDVIPWAAANGVRALEIDVRPGSHLDAATVDDVAIERLSELLESYQMRVSSLACYVKLNGVSEDEAAQARGALEQAIKLAARMEVATVCTLAGFPSAGKSRTATITEDLPGVFRPILDLAGRRGVRLALENWYATNIQHLDHWRALFDVLPDRHFGLNFDPSHLDWQGIDVAAAVREFSDRIFHVHAKDVAIDTALLARVGYLGEGWWRYVLPGYGRIRWGELISTLRLVGYNDVLSIEHEDASFPSEEGFEKAARYLNRVV